MDPEHKREGEQEQLWNGVSGNAWVDEQELIDRVLQPFADLLVDGISAASGEDRRTIRS
jgi:hypothetical protein